MYYFKLGDHVETIDGRTGYITDFCKCDLCKQRGFNAPIIEYVDKEDTEYPDYITIIDMYNDFRRFIRVGDYVFNNPVKRPKELKLTETQEQKDNSFEIFLKKWCAQKAVEKNEG